MEVYMKKMTIFYFFCILSVSSVFGQEYNLFYSGVNIGFITIKRETSGTITIIPRMREINSEIILNSELCSLIPEGEGFFLDSDNLSFITIEENTTTITNPDGSWGITVVDGNITTHTSSSGWGSRTVVEGNTTTTTNSDGSWNKIIVDGNITTETFSYGNWYRTVVDGNATTTTSFSGYWYKTIAEGNITTFTDSNAYWHKTVVDGNTTTSTDSDGYMEISIVEGNITTISKIYTDYRWEKIVIDRQGYNIYITMDRGGEM
jgi:formylmethanofuran dehydrogenase subunit C